MKIQKKCLIFVMVLTLLVGMMPISTVVAEVSNYTEIQLNEAKVVSASKNGGVEFFSFTPADSGQYAFYSYNNDFDTFGYIYDENMNQLSSNDDGGEDDNFRITYSMTGGTQYILKSRPYSDDENSGKYIVKVIKLVPPTSFKIREDSVNHGYAGSSGIMYPEFEPKDAIIEQVTWESSNTKVATVAYVEDNYVEISFISAGTATITATTESGLVASSTITVVDFPSIALDEIKTVELNSDNMFSYFYFTPEEDGYYAFYSFDNDYDTCGSILNSDMEIIAYNDDRPYDNNFYVSCKLKAGVKYILLSEFYNEENNGSFNICIEKIKYATKMEIVSMPERTECIEGYINEDNIEYFGLELKITWSDGSTSNWEYNYDWVVDEEYIYKDTSNFMETGTVELLYGEASVILSFTLIENPVDHIELVSGSLYNTYIENYNGYITSNYDREYFYYYTSSPSDAVIRIVYKNGTSKTTCIENNVDGYNISWDDNQFYEPWVLGTNNTSFITYLGHSVILPITVIENTVTSIEVVSGKLTCFENTYGYETENGFYYYCDVPDDVTVKINYSDNSSKIVSVNDKVNGYWFSFDTEAQYDTPWVLGDNNYLTISYLGKEAQLPVSVTKNPVDHIVLTSVPTREYIYGDNQYGYFYSENEYMFSPTDMTGLSFTVYYKNGTNKSFTYEDIIDNDKIDGYCYELYYENNINPNIGNFPVTFSYMGAKVDYTVVLKKSTVSSIAVTKLPDKYSFLNPYLPDFIGMELTITYTDNSTKVVTLTENNIEYNIEHWYAGILYSVEIDGHKLSIDRVYYDDGMQCKYIVSYLGQLCDINGIVFNDEREIDSIKLENVSFNGDGMNVNVTYTDKSTETIVIDILDFSYDHVDSYCDGYSKTEKGLLYYDISTLTDDNGTFLKYIVSILGKYIVVNVSNDDNLGDINGDSEITVSDALLVVHNVVGKIKLTDEQKTFADVDFNSEITTQDALRILHRVVGKISSFER